mmetsp:Transcript_35475/g.81176  ORF Transcript_35475/g.81176 Transcript_35475/m.81176 type:complete len:669 (+) Transcript_35475:129-2135(+)
MAGDAGAEATLENQLCALQLNLAEQHALIVSNLSDTITCAQRLQDELVGLRMENANLQAQLFVVSEGISTVTTQQLVLQSEKGHAVAPIADSEMPPLPLDDPPALPHTFGHADSVSKHMRLSPSSDVLVFNSEHGHSQFNADVRIHPPPGVAKLKKRSSWWHHEGDESQAMESAATNSWAPSARPNMWRSGTMMGAGRALFTDPESVKDAVRQHLIKRESNNGDLYKKRGVFQCIARNPLFEAFSTLVVTLNAVWIAVDTDLNDAPTPLQAPAAFQIAENSFCVYFTFEWIVRFMALERKKDLFKDRWFMFETGLVALMILETWVMASVVLTVAALSGNSSGVGVSGSQGAILRVLRLLRLNRAARIARVLNAIPELMVLVKGIVTAARSVFFTIALMMGIIYVFAVAFRELSKGTDLEEDLFRSVPYSMTMLLLWGAFPDLVDTVDEIGRASPYLAILFVGFIFLTSLTVMNMLIGVLVEMVSMVAAVEKEEIEVNFVKNKFLSMLPTIDADGDMMISKSEFEILLAQPECCQALQSVGVDVLGLVDLTDFIYMNTGPEGLSFEQIMDMVLNLRQKNKATVKDIVDLRKYIAWNLSHFQEQMEKIVLAKHPPLSNVYKKIYEDSSNSPGPLVSHNGVRESQVSTTMGGELSKRSSKAQRLTAPTLLQ